MVADEGLVRDQDQAGFFVEVAAIDRATDVGGHVEFGVLALPFLERAGQFDVDVAAFIAADVDVDQSIEVGVFDPFEGRVLENGLRGFVGI